MKRFIITVALMSVLSVPAFAVVQTETINYKHGKAWMQGFLAYNDSAKGQAPGIVIVHQWKGLGEYEKRRARELAELGYAAFAVDVYGRGVRPKAPEKAGAEAGKYKQDRQLFRDRIAAGFEAFKKTGKVNPNKIVVIGYCFGGMGALEFARSGAEVAGTVSFHGNLDTPNPADAKQIKGPVLVLHGGDDPYVPTADVLAFQNEMRQGGVDWQFVSYGGAVHAFSDPSAGSNPATGAAYNAKADRRSWKTFIHFLEEVFRRQH